MKHYLVLFDSTDFEWEIECENMRDFVKKCAEYEGNKDEWLSDIIESNAFKDDEKLFKFYQSRYDSTVRAIYEVQDIVFKR